MRTEGPIISRTNQLITKAAWAAAFGRVHGLPQEPGWCLQAVRVIIEKALTLPPHGLYRLALVAGTSRRPGTPEQRRSAAQRDPWAADLEASVKQLGWAIPAAARQAGDLVFNHSAAKPYGHVGILLTPDVLIENIDRPSRPGSIHLGSSLSITEFGSRPWTLVVRLPDELEVAHA